MNEQQAVDRQQGVSLPAIAFPKGGGAIQGMGEALNGGGVSGSATLALPVSVSAGRGFAPSLTLHYASTAGNSPFGLGFTLQVPSIARRTTKGVPRYQPDDTFVGPDGEFLVPEADTQGRPITTSRALHGQHYTVTRYYACAQTTFDRLEHWFRSDDVSDDFWWLLSADGSQHCFGNPATVTPTGAAAYIADPEDTSRIVRWLLLESVSVDGQHIGYEYKAEDNCNVEIASMPEQAHRRGAQRYLKRVHYGNREAAAGLYVLSQTGSMPAAEQWHFEVVFDYGEHVTSDSPTPTYTEQCDWPSRPDPFSDYAAGFEVRTHRLCRNVLVFHQFDELEDGKATLVRQLQLEHETSPAGALLKGVSVIGHGVDPATGELATVSMPPLDLAYGEFDIDDSAFRPFEALEAIAGGLKGLNDGMRYQLVDLYGEGVPGVLYRDGASFWYRAPHRPIDSQDENAIAYGDWVPLPQAPMDRLGHTRTALMDLTGDGQLDWVVTQPDLAGFFTLAPDKTWQGFTPFDAFPSEFLHPQAQLADLIGAGLSDLALIGPKSVRLYANRREAGFAPPEEVPHLSDDCLPVFDGTRTELVAFADVLGSGQSHLVRVRHNELVCWPNLGRGRFGTPITLATLPFDEREFDPQRVYLADLDGSGATDLIYVESERIRIFMNQAGNGLASPIERGWPQQVRYDQLCQVSFADVLGTGCAALVLTVPHMTPRHWVCEFAQKKPYLLERVNNNRGGDTQVRYRSSAQEWLDEKAATPNALSHLPFAVQVMSQLTQTDEITGNTLTQRYGYRRGFYDGHEREFRGFGCVTQWDTAVDAAALTEDTTLSAPVMTKTWFRVGAAQDDGYRDEYYAGDTHAPSLGDTRVVDSAGQLITAPDATLLREARRALRSRMMRQEVYGVDQTPAAAHPYSVSEYRYQVRVVQDPAAARVLLPMQLEQFTAQYERVPDDPMCMHQVVLEVDRYGDTTWSATVHYPRRSNPTTPAEYNDPQQAVRWITESRATPIHLDAEVGTWRLGLPCETKTAVVQPEAPPAGWLGYEQLSAALLDPSVSREVTAWQRHYYVDTDGNPLPLGQATPEGLLDKTLAAETTLETLEQACDGFMSADAIASWMEQAKYSFTDGYYWMASASTQYRGLADFYRPSSQTDVFGAETRFDYDASRCCVTQVTDAVGHVTQAEYDYRLLQPSRITDPNQNQQEAAYDPLGRLRVSSFYGTQGDSDVGFAPVDTYRTSVTTLDAALADPAGAIQHAASVYYEDLSSWMGHLDEQALNDAQRATLRTAGLMTADGGIRARCRWLSTDSELDGISPERWAQIRAAVAQARRTPIHAASFMHDGYPNDAERQIRCAVSFTDGFGRVLQSKQRVAPGPAWTADTDDNLVLEAEQPVSQQTQTRWAVSGRVEYNNKGLTVRVYQPYFIDTHRYVNDASLRQSAPHDTFYYDPLGRNTRVQTAAGYERRSAFGVWFDEHEDENDTDDDPLYRDTPTVEVRDNRGLTVRNVQYNRVTEGSDRQPLITRYVFDASAALRSSADPLRFAQNAANFHYIRTLSSQTLRTQSTDAGTQVQLSDARGFTAWAVNSNGHRQRWVYDKLGRPTARFEQPADATEACRERLVYGEADSGVGQNCRGRLIRHAHPAGMVEIGSYALSGQPLAETQRFLATLDEPDWPEDETAQAALLEATPYTTRWTYNALGETVTHTDAGEHCRRFAADIAGQLKAVWLRLADQDERCVASDFTYNASGQPLLVCAGNGVVRTYTYELKTQRLSRLSARRERDDAVLQDLSYTYDPVGNITRVEDAAQPVRYTRNQRVEAASDYQYDALYQLIRATGRESAQAGQQSAALPCCQSLDATQRVNYTRQYTYDAAGNLHQMQHAGAQRYTLEMTVAANSNRAVPKAWDVAPEQVDRYFDANGNLTQLQPGQPILWNACDQLSRVVQIERGDNEDDDERYAYSSQGQRARKVRRWRASSQQHEDDVRYLPGLERREHRQADADHLTRSNVIEALQVVVVDAGGIALRVLHWETGKPDAIDNDQARYSLDNQLGSSMLELDSAAQLLTYEEYYPYGGTAVWAAKSELEAKYKYVRYSHKERDATGMYYYGYRYYVPWFGRWLNPDPAETINGLNLYRIVKNSPISHCDVKGLMLRAIAKGAFGVGGIAYEAHKHSQKHDINSEKGNEIKNVERKSYGDREADKVIHRINERKDNFDVSKKIEGNIRGRVEAVGHLAQGNVPGKEALKKGADVLVTVGEFAATGDVKQADKTALAKAAAKDAYNNMSLGFETVKKASKGAAVVATMSPEKTEELAVVANQFKEEIKDEVITGVSTGMAVGAMLEGAAAAVPHPVAKGTLKGLSLLWSIGGAVNMAEKIGEAAKKHEEAISSEFGHEAFQQVKNINNIKRGEIIEKYKSLTGGAQ